MRFIFSLLIILMVAFGRCQTATYHIDSLDTITIGDMAYVKCHNIILERLHYMSGKIDVVVLYIYREGVLVRREWWRAGKMLSCTLE